jgi:8-oxo-dGTP pyrophosphatase MutT (NUDIX family)
MPTATYLYFEYHLRATASAWYFNKKGEWWTGHSLRKDNQDGWQPTQGGIEPHEVDHRLRSYYREIWQETGIRRSQLSFIAASSRFFSYQFPVPREGDKYEWITLSPAAFLVRDGVTMAFDKTDDPEFDTGAWIMPEELLDVCPSHKKNVFKDIIEAFQPIADALRSLNVPAEPPLDRVVKAVMRDVTVRASMESGGLVRAMPEFPGVLVRQNGL